MEHTVTYLTDKSTSYENHLYTTPQFPPCLPTGGRTLQILRAKESDGGQYTCIAINQAGESKKKVSLTVYGLFSLSENSFMFQLV